METNTRINSGTLLVRGSEWSRKFFAAWWLHPDAAIGGPDQWTFDELWRVDALGLVSSAKAVVLPATAFNSEPPFYETFRGGAAQPVVHLMGDAASVRQRIFARMAAGLCASKTRSEAAAEDWPPNPSWMLKEMRAGYALAVADTTQAPLQRIHSLDRMGMIYQAEGRHEERAALLRQALSLKEGVYGADSPALAHEVQVLANVLSMLERHEEALPLMQKALKLSELTRDPRGQPMPHLVAAAHGDLGCAFHAAVNCVRKPDASRSPQLCTVGWATGKTRFDTCASVLSSRRAYGSVTCAHSCRTIAVLTLACRVPTIGTAPTPCSTWALPQSSAATRLARGRSSSAHSTSTVNILRQTTRRSCARSSAWRTCDDA